ncbi:hypothetical protein B0T24DRAFT_690371 [Lasiosphaeria ovina]|uniref:Carrier domain-containing protein n=1 Tax=Lasiosphaeria ovina TaxID=92902 RepID=A0AAE0JU46_9PEZI|nr:hypothetical protein B0T24DRAFT_690371 [Lasiosphaeria ovina]
MVGEALLPESAETSPRPSTCRSLWPPRDLLQNYAKFVVEAARRGESLDGHTLEQVKCSYDSIASLIEPADKPALRFPDDSRGSISHRDLRKFAADFDLPIADTQSKSRRKPIVCIAIPSGPILAAVCLAVANRFIAAPVNPAVCTEQFEADVRLSGASCILTTKEDADRLGLGSSSNRRTRIGALPVFLVSSGREGDDDKQRSCQVGIRLLDGTLLLPSKERFKPNKADDIAIVLFTSGTSGTKKLVPITVHNIFSGVAFVIESWALAEDDVCLNMMPLYHIGGLVRNIFSPILSGGSVICCPAFDPNLFWDVVKKSNPTWYYASPSMHQMLLAQMETRRAALAKSRIRLACNAAGGLLPALANKLQRTFECTVLPSYGMTECMPISSPPIDYELDRPGTSGLTVGPELKILDSDGRPLPRGIIGRICVRGEPVFPGYLLPSGEVDRSAFTQDGWFDTGDLGHMSKDGYLFITGRSKEVINRGGEIISPFEVENAIISAAQNSSSPIFGRVAQALAFSVLHDILQEIVGVVLVTPPHTRRVDIRQLRQALRSSLQQAKWPALIVYMDDLPRRNNKVIRIRLSGRLGLPKITESTLYSNLHWEAICPPADTEMTASIPSRRYVIDGAKISEAITSLLPRAIHRRVVLNQTTGTLEVYIAPVAGISISQGAPELDEAFQENLVAELPKLVDGCLVPHKYMFLPHPIPLDSSGELDSVFLRESIRAQEQPSKDRVNDATTTSRVTRIVASILSCAPTDIPRHVNFFALGGDSIRAGKLLSALRSEFGVSPPVDLVFRDGSVTSLAAHLDERLQHTARLAKRPSSSSSTTSRTRDDEPANKHAGSPPQVKKTHSSTNLFLLVLQLTPLAVLYPVRRGAQWTTFLIALAYTKDWPTSDTTAGRLLNIVGCILFTRFVIRATMPFAGILAKWVIVGRYREGVYPMWGLYHTRWWFVQKIVDICGMGVFGCSNMTRVCYYRLLGAKIGKGVKLHGTQLGEWDLVEVGDGAILGKCICRPFAGERNTAMYLGRILIGAGAYVGVASVVAPGTAVPAGVCIGANSSSWELADASESNRDLASDFIPKPHWLLTVVATAPLLGLTRAVRSVPWLLGLLGLVRSEPERSNAPLVSILHWFAGGQRTGFHFLALALGCLFGPFFLIAVVLAIKETLDAAFGKLGPSRAEGRSQVERWRMALMKAVYPVSALHDLTALFGHHYESTSVVMRLLGAKIGRRVYWPGTGPGVGDYHLLDVGDDVVFGSRAHLITSDAAGSDTITIRNRAMIADRVTCLPGVTIGKNTIMGSGALTRRGKTYPAQGVFVGSKGGDALCLSTTSASVQPNPGSQPLRRRPHGRSETQESIVSALSMPSSLASTESPSVASSATNPVTVNSTGVDLEKATIQVQVLHDQGSQAELRPKSPPVPDANNDNKTANIADTSTPFGRAFYLKQAPYHVLGQFSIFAYSSFIRVFTAVYWNAPFIVSVQLFDRWYQLSTFSISNTPTTASRNDPPPDVNPLHLFGLFTACYAALITLQSLLALLLVIAAKWALLGRRQPGSYSWDTHPYCQRWQAFLAIETLRRSCFRGCGVLGMLTGTHWLVLYFRALGAKIGKDCALFANGRPSLLLTEPDLLTLGDRVVVDDASLVGHINTRGRFDLNRLEVGDRCVLRTGSRLLSGATMQKDSCLLEHTMVMGGETVEAGVTMQGWPAEVFDGERVVF